MQTLKFAGTVPLAETQEQYNTLHVFIDRSRADVPMVCCFKLTPEELAKIATTGHLWYSQLTFGQPFQPMNISPDTLVTFDPPRPDPVRTISFATDICDSPEGKLLKAALIVLSKDGMFAEMDLPGQNLQQIIAALQNVDIL